MNFLNLKKFLILSSAVLAFGNMSSAYSEDNPIMLQINNEDVSWVILNPQRLQNMERDMSSAMIDTIRNILRGNNKLAQDVRKLFKIAQTDESLGNYKGIVNNILKNNNLLGFNKNTYDKNVSLELMSVIKFIKNMESLDSDVFNNINSSDYLYFSIFKSIAEHISYDNINKLEKDIQAYHDNSQYNSSEGFSFLAATIQSIIRISDYQLDSNSVNVFKTLMKKDDMFKLSANGKLFSKCSFDNSNVDNSINLNSEYNQERNNFNKILKKLSTHYEMDNSDYNTILMHPVIANQGVVSKIESGQVNLPTEPIKSTDALLNYLIEVSEGKHDKDSLPINPNEMPQQVDQLLQKSYSDFSELDKKLVEEVRKKQNQTAQEKELLNYAKFHEALQVIKDKLEKLIIAENIKSEHKTKLEVLKSKVQPLEQLKSNEINTENENRLKECESEVKTVEDEMNKKPEENKYNIPGITDVLEKRGLKIASIEVSNTVPAGVKVLKLHEVNGLVQSNAGVVTVDMRMAPHNPRIDKPFRKLFTSGMISTTMYQAGIWDEKQKQEVMDSNYLNITLEKTN